MIRRAFVVERPLQILISLSIINQIDSNAENLILVADCFHNARQVCERLKEKFGTRFNVEYFSTYKDAIDYCGKITFSELFLHWDVGFGTNIRILKLIFKSRGKIKLNVFEEGIGTYRDDIYPIWKKRIFRFVGLPVNNGGNRFTRKIFVYDPKEYLSKVTKPAPVIEKIEETLPEIIDKYRSELYFIFDIYKIIDSTNSVEKKECLIYLSNWSFKVEDVREFYSYSGYKVLKLHPHIKEKFHSIENDFFIAPNSLPAEMLISFMSEKFNKVIVFHNGSSVSRYIKNENVQYNDLCIN